MTKLLSKIIVGSLSIAALAMAGPVTNHGGLTVSGNKIVDKNNQPYQLRGMSFFWSQWESEYYTAAVVNELVDDWNVNLVRAALGVYGSGSGYLANKSAEKQRITTVVDAAIAKDIYAIIDWHDHCAADHQNEAIAFFEEMATKYKNNDNVIYELFNEPMWKSDASGCSKEGNWTTVKNYANAVTAKIRAIDSDALILVGTPTWSQDVDDAAASPVNDANTAYVLHFYAGTHGASIRSNGNRAMFSSNKAIFISEFGLTQASGDGALDLVEAEKWLDWADDNDISYANWSIADKDETSAALKSGASPQGNWNVNSDLTASGKWMRTRLRSYPADVTPSSSSGDLSSSSSSSSSSTTAGDTPLWSPGYGNQSYTGGFWYGYNDLDDEGTSTWSCAGTTAEKGDPVDDCVTDSEVAIGFNVTKSAGGGSFGYAGLGIVLDQTDDEVKIGFDLSTASGITLTYSSSEDMIMHVVDDGGALGWNTHQTTLDAGNNISRTLSWNQFIQVSGWGTEGDVADVVANLKEIQFQAHSSNISGASTFKVHSLKLNGVSLADGREALSSSSSLASSSSVTSSSSLASSSSVTSSSSLASSSSETSSSSLPSSSSEAPLTDTPLWSPGYGNASYTGGFWYGYNDLDDEGTSTWSCAGTTAEKGDPVDECVTDSEVAIGFNVTKSAGGGSFGYAGLGIVLDQTDAEVKIGFDVSAGTGITLTYSSSEDMIMHVVDDGSALGWNTHQATLDAGNNITRTLTWNQFIQAAGWGTEGDVADVVANLKEIQFQAHSSNISGASTFKIHAIQIDDIALADGRDLPNSSSSGISSSSVDNQSSSSDDVTDISFSSLTGVDFRVTESQMVFDIAQSEFYTIEVYSLLGAREVVIVNGYVNQGSLEYSTSELTKGVYIIRVSNDNGIKTFKLNLR